MTIRRWLPLFLLLALVAAFFERPRPQGSELILHEWGTFTCLQDETGQALGGINTDDEPVPDFVHSLGPIVRNRTDSKGTGAPVLPGVTLRLETPVVYIYPSVQDPHPRLDLHVEFRGGWLTQFYPAATRADAPGLPDALSSRTVGRLEWDGIQVGTPESGPSTDLPVWTAPRLAGAPGLTVGQEHESYLFYRGVGHLDSPLRIRANRLATSTVPVARLWVAHIRADGTTAYRRVEGPVGANQVALPAPEGFSAGNLARLRLELQAALEADGLYEREAVAMLKTWEVSYFQSPGLRVFYLVPRVWTDQVLPLHLSVPAQVERVMMGRVELISPEQREVLERMRGGRAEEDDYRRLGRFAEALLRTL
ncbi:MAG: hypothetical protein AB1758_30885 [Candidatus Eremiobacterota bacterium]